MKIQKKKERVNVGYCAGNLQLLLCPQDLPQGPAHPQAGRSLRGPKEPDVASHPESSKGYPQRSLGASEFQ